MKILKKITKASGKQVLELVNVCCKNDWGGVCGAVNKPKTIIEAVKETIVKVVEKVTPKEEKKKPKKK